jgi:hypothetical protein
MWSVIKHNPISAFAVLIVAFIGGFLAYMAVWQTNILSSPLWCAKAVGAERAAPGQTAQQSLDALRGCNNLLLVQLQALAVDSHINTGTFALVLIVLIVVVVAGARMAFKATTSGIEGSVSKDGPLPVIVENPPTNPVPTVTPAPVPTPAPAPNPNYKGPAMPPPPTP